MPVEVPQVRCSAEKSCTVPVANLRLDLGRQASDVARFGSDRLARHFASLVKYLTLLAGGFVQIRSSDSPDDFGSQVRLSRFGQPDALLELR